jgi:uncharacterized membrane protein YoaK (UPF0700 family)
MDDRRAGAVRDVLVVVLTLGTGAVDATTFLHLGNVFSSVITGNLVLLAMAAGTRRAALAISSGVALVGYAAGVLAAAPIAARRSRSHRVWPAAVTATLLAEGCVLAGLALGWELTSGHPAGSVKITMAAVAAAAMGMQSAAVRRLGNVSTTYLTGTLTGVVSGLVTRTRPDRLWRSIGVLLAIVCGALAAALVTQYAPAWLPLVVLAPVSVVIAMAVVSARADPGGREPKAGTW